MEQLLQEGIGFLTELTNESGLAISLVFSSMVIIVESLIPFLPIAVLISLNVIIFGPFIGFLVSWLSNILGCMIAFVLIRELLASKISDDSKLHKMTEYVNRVSFSALILTIAIPFTPAFAVNIGAGLSDISYRKFFISLVVGKAGMVYFWAFVGKSLEKSITDINTLIQLGVIILVMYLVSKLVNRKFHIEGD